MLLLLANPLRSSMNQPIIFIFDLKAGQQHVLKSEYKLFSSDRRYRIPRFNKVRLKHSFVHQSILKLKMELNQRPNLP